MSLNQGDTASYLAVAELMSSTINRIDTLAERSLETYELRKEASNILQRMNRTWPIRIGDIQLWRYETIGANNKPQIAWTLARYLQEASNERYFSALHDTLRSYMVDLRPSTFDILDTPKFDNYGKTHKVFSNMAYVDTENESELWRTLPMTKLDLNTQTQVSLESRNVVKSIEDFD
ncbi:uncharacterized protein BDZ99DRAFT_466281 [Mytilinidion resinicola]|uniref:Uncharacterized protein n=1 Tax=Mytilinidion resinicola TaxID=574789 RepID=A0A6A6YDR2_9PEZI|nr:uncharacterized protein BDZ99DRAFT_466281 [Mytilinidion resinicola]KAF2805987.1 hypothetical protein BDZ99DRAFT_466281 [Mytilinidion resinicola]